MINYQIKPLKIKAILDGRPGHEKQTLGILKALEKLTPITVEYETVKPVLSSYIKNSLTYLLGKMFGFANSFLLSSFDIIIGTGSYTHLPILIQKEEYLTNAVTCMTPESFLINKFDLCFIPMHDNPEPKKNLFITVGPPNLSIYNSDKDNKKGLILVGGVDKKDRNYKWDTNYIIKKIEEILINNPSIEWTISSSPRTPSETSENLKKIASYAKNALFFDYKDTKKGWVEKEYAQSRYACLTADSMSMIYEAVSAGCIVGIIPVLWNKKNNKFEESIRYLTERGLAVNYNLLQKEQSLSFNNRPLNEAERCAKEILNRWHPQRLK